MPWRAVLCSLLGGIFLGCSGDDIPCLPTSGGPHWLVEGEDLQAAMRCATGIDLPVDLEVEGVPPGADFDAESRVLRWTPGLGQAGNYDLVFRIPSYGETKRERIGVADAWESAANLPISNFLEYPEEFGLPVLHLEVEENEMNGTSFVPAKVTYGGHLYEVGAKYRGKSSRKYPKKSMTLKFSKDDRFADPSRNFVGRKKIALITTFDDNSYVRARLAFELWRRLDPRHVFVRTYHVVVYVNGSYHGLYLLADKVNDDLVKRFGLSGDGNLYQATKQEANFSLLTRKGDPKQSLAVGYRKKEGAPAEGEPGAFDDLEALVRWVAEAPDEEFRLSLKKLVRIEDYEHWWFLVMFALAGDNDEKNTYHFHDPRSGPWRVFLWDFNWSFGQDWRTRREDPATPRLSTHNLLFKRLLDDPDLRLKKRLKAELRRTFALDEVLPLVDGYLAEVGASARRDEAKWGESYRAYYFQKAARQDFLSHREEAEYLRAWIRARWRYLDEKF